MKYYIIPREDIAMEINAADKDAAMDIFALKFDTDLNTYFRAVTEDEYAAYISERNFEGAHNQFVEWAVDVLREDFDWAELDEDDLREIAEDAWDINCEGNGLTEYECIEEAVENIKKEY